MANSLYPRQEMSSRYEPERSKSKIPARMTASTEADVLYEDKVRYVCRCVSFALLLDSHLDLYEPTDAYFGGS
jgi:hypothetical protein